MAGVGTAATRWRDSAIGARRAKKCILVDVNGLVGRI